MKQSLKNIQSDRSVFAGIHKEVVFTLLCVLYIVSPSSLASAVPPPLTPPQTCSRSLAEEHLDKPASAFWDNEAGYIVAARKEDGGARKSYYYTADTLLLKREMIRSLLGTPNAPVTGLKHVTFDARVVEIDDRLVFDTAAVTILADKIVFNQGGAIIFTDAPQDDGDGVTLVANSIDFRHSALHPFQFVTGDKDWHASSKRMVEVISPNPLFASDGDKPSQVRKLTLDADYAELPEGDEPMRTYNLKLTKETAEAAYEQSFDSDMRWPEQTATKLARMFALAPFQKDNLMFIQDKLTTYSGAWKHSQQRVTLAIMDRLQAAINSGQDQLGFTRYEVPRRTFVAELAQFQGRYVELLDILEKWDSVIVDAHSSTKPDPQKLTSIAKAYSSSTGDGAITQATIDGTLTELLQIEQQVAAREPLIQQRLQSAKEAFDDEINKQGNAAKVRFGAKILSMASAILPVATPVALAVSVAVSTSGELIASNQTGDSVTTASAVLTIPESLAFAQGFRSQFTKVKDGWDKFRSGQDDLNTATTDDARKAATDKRAEGLSNFGENVSTLFKGLSLPTAPELKMDDFQKRDGRLQMVLKETGDYRSRQTDLLTQLALKRKELENITSTQTELAETRKQILRVDAHNDPDGARLESLAWTVRQRIMSSLAYEASILVRAYTYHTTRTLKSPITDKYFWTVYTPDRPTVAENTKPSDYFFKGGTADELNAELGSQRNQLKTELGTLYNDAKDGYGAYKLGIVAWQETITELHIDCTKDDLRCHFLRSINAEIARQVQFHGNNLAAALHPLLIPIDVVGTRSQRPNRLIDVTVNATFKNPAAMRGKTILLSVVHPIYGRIDLEHTCYTVDFRHFDAINNEQEFTTTCTDNAKCARLSSLTRSDYTAENSELVFMPLKTAYSLKVDVQDAQQPAIPVIAELKITFKLLY